MRVTKSISSHRDRISIQLIFVSVLIGLCYQSSVSLISNSQSFLLVILSILTGYLGCLSFILNHRLPTISRVFLFIVVYLFLIGLSYGSFFNKEFLTIALVQDFRYVMYFISGCIFAYSDENMASFHSIMKVLSVISIPLGIYALVSFDYLDVSIETRESTWSLSYMLWWAAGSCWVYWAYYALFMRKDYPYAIGPTLFYIVLGLLFLKREVLAYSGIILMVYLFFNGRNIGRSFKTIIALIALFLVVYYFNPNLFGRVYDLIMNRFNEVDNLAELDRSVEAADYLNEASVKQLLLGNGIGYYHQFKDVNLASSRGLLNALHLGYINVLYKGGVVFSLYYIVIFIIIIKKMFSKNLSPYMKVCLGSSLSYFISLLYAGSWTYTIASFSIAAPLFYALSRVNK